MVLQYGNIKVTVLSGVNLMSFILTTLCSGDNDDRDLILFVG